MKTIPDNYNFNNGNINSFINNNNKNENNLMKSILPSITPEVNLIFIICIKFTFSYY
jgi:hypothetical protein